LLEKTNNKLLEKTNNSRPLNRFNKKCQVNINFKRGVLLPGAPDRAFLNKFKQREQIYHLQLYISPISTEQSRTKE